MVSASLQKVFASRFEWKTNPQTKTKITEI